MEDKNLNKNLCLKNLISFLFSITHVVKLQI